MDSMMDSVMDSVHHSRSSLSLRRPSFSREVFAFTSNWNLLSRGAYSDPYLSSSQQDDVHLEKMASRREQQRRRNRWSTAVETFSPVWFAVVMNTGILSVLMHTLPYKFPGLDILSTVFYVLSLVLFTVIFLIHMLRLILYPRSAYYQTVSDHEQACLWGCCPIAFMTLTGGTAIIVSNAGWGGHAFTLVAYVMWWICTASIVTCAIVVYIFLVKNHTASELKLTVTMFIPAVGTVTDAVVGGLVASQAADLSPQLAIPMILVSYIVLGLGLFIAIYVYFVFLYAMMSNGIYQPPAKYPGLMLLVGPMGQCAAAVQLLATAAEKTFGSYDHGQFLSDGVAMPIQVFSVVLALMFMGFDLFWLMFALYLIIEGLARRRIPFTMAWWSTIFPVATLDTTFIALSKALDSSAFRVLAAGLLIILVIDYSVCWVFTIWGVFEGRILDGREQLADMVSKRI